MTAEQLTAASTTGLVIVAVIAAVIALIQVRQARKLREEEAAPYVVVDIASGAVSRQLLYLTIENTGKTVARNVRVNFDPPLQQAMDTAGYPIADWSALRDGVQTLTPGRKVDALFDEAEKLYAADTPRRYAVTIECKNGHGRQLPTVQYVIDLDRLFGALHAEELGVHQLVKTARKIEQTLTEYRTEGLAVRTYPGK